MSQQSFDLEAFKKLPEIQRALLHLISIIYLPVAATPLASCAHRLGINDPRSGDSFTLHSLRPVLVDLIHNGWLEGSQGKYSCPNHFLDDVLLSAINEDVFKLYAEQVLSSFSATESFGRILWQSVEHGVSHARIYLFLGKAEKLQHVLELLHERYQYRDSELIDPGFYTATFGSPVNQDLLAKLNDELFSLAFLDLSENSLKTLNNQAELWELLQQRIANITNLSGFQFFLLQPQAKYSIFSGDHKLFPELPAGIHHQSSSMLKDTADVQYDDRHVEWHLANCAKQLILANTDSAMQAYENATDLYREIYKKRKNTAVVFGNQFEIFYLLALLTTGEKQHVDHARQILKKIEPDTSHVLLDAYAETLHTGIFNFSTPLTNLENGSLTIIIYCLIKHW
jgi:hypothetical protein